MFKENLYSQVIQSIRDLDVSPPPLAGHAQGLIWKKAHGIYEIYWFFASGPKTRVFFGIKKFFKLETYPEPPKGVF